MAQRLEFKLKNKTSLFVSPVHSKNTDKVSHTITMYSARQKAVLIHMSAKSAQQGIISANAHNVGKITSHCHGTLNKA